MSYSIERVEEIGLTTVLEEPAKALDDKVMLRVIPKQLHSMFIEIDAYGTQPETRQVSGVDDQHVTLNAPLSYNHAEGAVVRRVLQSMTNIFPLNTNEIDLSITGAHPNFTNVGYIYVHSGVGAVAPIHITKINGGVQGQIVILEGGYKGNGFAIDRTSYIYLNDDNPFVAWGGNLPSLICLICLQNGEEGIEGAKWVELFRRNYQNPIP